MHPLVVRYIFIFSFIFILNSLRLFFARKPIKHKVEMPGKGQRIGLGVQVAITYLIAFMALLGFLMRDSEMAIVCSVMTLVFVTLIYFTRRKFKRMYEETEDHFVLKDEYRVFHVDYENIMDWVPLSKQIGVMDKTQPENKYICVHLSFSDPQILLEKLAEMTFAGKFQQTEASQPDDPNREQEFIDFLKKNGYEYIAKDFLKE